MFLHSRFRLTMFTRNKPCGILRCFYTSSHTWHPQEVPLHSDYVNASTVSIAISVPKLEHEQEEQKLCDDKSAWEGEKRDFCRLKTGTNG